MNEKVRGSIEMTAAMVISGTIGLLVLLSGQPVFDVVFWRCTFGGVTLLVICGAMGFLTPSAMSKQQLLLTAIGGIAIVANWLLLFAAFSRASISIATAVYNTQPFMLAGLGAVFLGERLTLAKLVWLGLAFLGMIMIVQSEPEAGDIGADYFGGIVLALSAAFLYAVAALITKKLKGVRPHVIALIQVLVGVLMLVPFANFGALPTAIKPWAMLISLGVIHTGLMYILLYGAIQKLPTSLIGSLSFIYPIVAILVDFGAFGLRLQPLQILGAAAILFAAAGMTLGWSLWRQRESDLGRA